MIIRYVIAPVLKFLQRGVAATWLRVREAMGMARIKSILTGDPFHYIDEFLQVWEYAVFVDNRIIGLLSERGPQFENRLARAWVKDDERAASRAVFYMAIQAAGAISCESPLGLRLREYFGPGLRTVELDGGECFFVSDVHQAWRSRSNRISYDSLDRWEQSDLAQDALLPLYENMQKRAEQIMDVNRP